MKFCLTHLRNETIVPRDNASHSYMNLFIYQRPDELWMEEGT
jgi:hypothetical protein